MYEFYYWPGIQGRGEFVRLALEEAGAKYVDVARGPGGVDKMMALMGDEKLVTPPFAPPFLVDGKKIVAQTANVLMYLGESEGLAPKTEAGKLWTHQIQLTITDFVVQAHDTHHPVGASFYYEDQKPEAARHAENFRKVRIPKFLAWFERILESNPKGPEHLVGARVTYADLSLFQMISGLKYAFPRAMERELKKTPHIVALHAAVAERKRIKAYLESDRRIAFNEKGIFRHYPELDG
jgi:glutathione S-transferase